MDYLEGALLGSLWSDTDFETTPHKGAALWLSVIFWVLGVSLVLAANRGQMSFFASHPVLWLALLAILFLLSPLLSYLYYDVPVPARLGILLLQGVKFSSVWFLIYSLVVPHLIIGDENLLNFIMKRYDGVVSGFLENSNMMTSASGLILAVILIALGALLTFIAVILFAALFPTGMLRLTAGLQRLYDLLFLRLTRNRRKQRMLREKDKMFAPRDFSTEDNHPIADTAPRPAARTVQLRTEPGFQSVRQNHTD